MKTWIFAVLLAFSGLVQAQSLRELECESRFDRVNLNLDFGFGRGMRSADAELYVDGGLVERMFMNLFSTSQFRYRYTGSFGANFELDTWPDLKPQWGRHYRGTYTGQVGDRRVRYSNLTCRFR